MKCQNCGTELENGAAFCPNCGKAAAQAAPAPAPAEQPAEQQSNPAPTSEQPNPTTAGAAPTGEATSAPTGTGTSSEIPPVMPTVNPSVVNGGQNPQKQKQLIIAAGCVVVAVVLLIILIASTRTSAKGAVKDYYKAVEKQSASKMIKCIPKDYLKELMDEYDMSKKEVKEAVADVLEYEDDDIDDIQLTFKDKEKLDDDDVDEFNESYLDDDDFKEVKKVIKYEVKVKVTSDGGDNVDTDTSDCYVYKYGGSWYCTDALAIVAYAVALAD